MNRKRHLSFLSVSVSLGALVVACSGASSDGGDQSSQAIGGASYVHTDCQKRQNVDRPMICFSERRVNVVQPDLAKANTTPQGFGPADLASAYAIPAGGGAGLTVAIIDAQDDPNAESDLGVYRSQFGLPACTTANGCFKKVNQSGTSSPLPTGDTGWGGEISLDLDMVSAACPNCKILLVEATSASNANLGAAVNTAVKLGAVAISNSYGRSEDSSVTSDDSSYYQHPGVLITASAGDNGFGAAFPATGSLVLAVGGTKLSKASNARGWTEVVWNEESLGEGATGSGCSGFVTKPSWQNDTGCSKRMEADLSAVADPQTGVAVYDTYGGASAGASGWEVYGGTSAASPLIAALFTALGKATTTNGSYPWKNPANFNDVTSGNNGSCSVAYECTAGAGYDGPTGWGTPNGAAIGSGTPPPPQDAGTPPVDAAPPPVDAAPPPVDAAPPPPVDAGTCKHSACSSGVKLTKGCDTCATDVCDIDSYCCRVKWDNICVGEAQQYCGGECP
jgi:subtilase family serine protease